MTACHRPGVERTMGPRCRLIHAQLLRPASTDCTSVRAVDGRHLQQGSEDRPPEPDAEFLATLVGTRVGHGHAQRRPVEQSSKYGPQERAAASSEQASR